MKHSKVYFSSSARGCANNQDYFVTDQYFDHIIEQKEMNHHLTASLTEVKKSCQTILDNIQKQNMNFSTQKNIKRDYLLHLKSILRKIEIATESNQEILKQLKTKDDFQKKIIEQQNTLTEKQELLEVQQQTLKTNLEVQGTDQEETLSDVKVLLEKLLQSKESITKVLSSLPTNYPIKQLVVSGEMIPVTSFVMANEKNGVAIFSNDNESVYVAIDKIEAIYWM